MRINRVGLMGLALGSIALATMAGTYYLWLLAPLTVDQRIAATASSLAAGAFIIAILAGIIAALAYRQSIRKPHLTVALDVTRRKDRSSYFIAVHNDGQVSAANVIVWVILQAEAPIRDSSGWTVDGYKSFRWEARAGLVIHPNVPPYTLPVLQLGPSDPLVSVQYTVVADGTAPESGEVTNRASAVTEI